MATVSTLVTVKANDWDENEAVRSTIAGAQVYLARNPRAKAAKLSAEQIVTRPYGYYRTALKFRLTEDVIRVPSE